MKDEQTTNAPMITSAATCFPSFAVRHRKGEETIELRVPTGDDDTPHCWHAMDLTTAKRLRRELCEAVDYLEALLDLRKYNEESSKARNTPAKPKP